MLRKLVGASLVLAGIAGTLHAEEVFPGGPRFDGVITIVALTGSSCSSLDDRAGDQHAAIFRSRGTSTAPEAMSIAMPRGTMYVAADFDGTFQGRRQIVDGRF